MPLEGGSFREGFVGQPISLNPASSDNPVDQEASVLLYNTLGNLMAGHDVSQDGLTYNIQLHQDLKWSDGSPLTSDDVVYTVKTIQDPATNSPLAQEFAGVTAQRVSQIQVRFTLTTPYAFFLRDLKRLLVIPQHIWGAIPPENFRLSDYNLEPVGSGPYKFQSFTKTKDGFITDYHLTVNPNYYGPRPYIPDFYLDFYKNISDVAQALARHDIQGYGTLLPLSDTANLRGVTDSLLDLPNYYAVFFDQAANPALADKGLRTALAEAVNVPAITAQVPGALDVTGPWLGSANASGTLTETYDPNAASSSIAAWKSKNKGAPIDITLTVPNVGFLMNAAKEIAADWQAVGVDSVQIQPFDPQDPTDRTIASRSYEALLFGNVFENANDLFPFWDSSQAAYPGSNLALYQNPKVDALLEAARATTSTSTQISDLTLAQNDIVSDAPAVFLFSLPYHYYHTSNLGGFAAGPISTPGDRFLGMSGWYVEKVKVLN